MTASLSIATTESNRLSQNLFGLLGIISGIVGSLFPQYLVLSQTHSSLAAFHNVVRTLFHLLYKYPGPKLAAISTLPLHITLISGVSSVGLKDSIGNMGTLSAE